MELQMSVVFSNARAIAVSMFLQIFSSSSGKRPHASTLFWQLKCFSPTEFFKCTNTLTEDGNFRIRVKKIEKMPIVEDDYVFKNRVG
jgi:hypothetical protein